MDSDQTVSVSKGVFVFKSNFKPPTRHSKHRRKSVDTPTVNIFSSNLWYKQFSYLWTTLQDKIELLNNEMFSSVLSDLIEFIKNSHNTPADEIPTAALLTGINMPDHEAQFMALSKGIKRVVSPHVACLYSQDCQNIKYLMEHMIDQFVNEEGFYSDSDEMLMEDNKRLYKKNQLSLDLLQCWYEDLYQENMSSTPKKQKTKGQKKPLIVIFPDFESLNPQILQKFILIASWRISVLPFVFVFGVATSLTILHTSLPYQVSSKISIHVFNSQPSIVYLNNILENIFFTILVDCPFQLGGKVFNLFTDIFLFYDLSVSNFIQNIKYAMMEHFSFGNVMALCNWDKADINKIIHNFTHEDCENARHIMSFRKLVENEPYRNKIKLLTDDTYFKRILEEEILKLIKYIKRLHIFLKCLLILVQDLPKAPLGKQIRELYAIAVTRNITKTPEYKECFQLLGFQSKEELAVKVFRIIDYLLPLIRDNHKQNKIKDFVNELQTYLHNMNNFNMNEIEEAVMEIEKGDTVITGQMDRKQLKEKLLGMSKHRDKPMNRYEKMRKNIINLFLETFEQYLVEPSTFYFHEVYFFNNISIQNYIIGTHRSAVHNGLNDPQYYLQCTCCQIPNSSSIRSCMPDICIAYKLHLECGKMINLYDWLQAFLSIVDPMDFDDDGPRRVDPDLQARFTQAVAELEYLGFIKSSKRKADHVTRLTWGG